MAYNKVKLMVFILIGCIAIFPSLVSASDVSVWQGQYYAGTTFNTGTYDFSFDVYDALTGGNICYSNTTMLTTGSFGEWITEQNGVNSACNNVSKDYYLNININGVDQTPRRRLVIWNSLRKDIDETTSGTFQANTQIIAPVVQADTQVIAPVVNATQVMATNLTTSYGFFSYIGNLVNRITKLFVQDIDASGNVNASNYTLNGTTIQDWNDLSSGIESDPIFTAENVSIWNAILNISLTPGPKGDPGVNGTNGINGINGTDGVNGANGVDGINGTNGINGINGTNGLNGLNGTNGLDCNYANIALKNQSETFAGNITATQTGFFGWLGSLTSRITKLFVRDIDATGNIETSQNVSANYFKGDGSLLTNLPAGGESDPVWTANSSTVARTGNCPAGQVVQNTTTSGVQCMTPAAAASYWDRTGTTLTPATAGDNINTTGKIQGKYYSNDGSQGMTDTTSYWICTDNKCKNFCQLQIKNGLIIGCS